MPNRCLPAVEASTPTETTLIRYVDSSIGNDSYDGLQPTVSGSKGPWATWARVKTFLTGNADRSVAIKFAGNFGLLDLTGVQTGRYGSLLLAGRLSVSYSGATLGSATSPTDESGTRLRISFTPGALPANPEGYILALSDGNVAQYGCILDYDNAAGWMDVSCQAAVSGYWYLLLPIVSASWDLAGCIGVSGNGASGFGSKAPNIVIGGFDMTTYGTGFVAQGCSGIELLACKATGTYITFDCCDLSNVGAWGVESVPSIAESFLCPNLLFGDSGVPGYASEATVGVVDGNLGLYDCSRMRVWGASGSVYVQGGNKIEQVRSRCTAASVSDVHGFSERLNVYYATLQMRGSSVSVYSPFFQDSFALDTFSYFAVRAVQCDVVLSKYIRCHSTFAGRSPITLDKCRVDLYAMDNFNIDVVAAYAVEAESSSFGDWMGTPPAWASIPAFGGTPIANVKLAQCTGRLGTVSKAAQDATPCPVIIALMSSLDINNLLMGVVISYGADGIIWIDRGSYIVVATFSGTNADPGAVAATVHNRSVLQVTSTLPGGNLWLGGNGSIPFPAGTTDDLGSGTPEMCIHIV